MSPASSYEVTTLLRSRAAVGDTKVSGRRVTSKAPLAHLVGGSGQAEASPTAILQDTHSLEGEFCEVRLCASRPRFLTTEAGGPLLYPPTTKTNRPPSDGVDRSA